MVRRFLPPAARRCASLGKDAQACRIGGAVAQGCRIGRCRGGGGVSAAWQGWCQCCVAGDSAAVSCQSSVSDQETTANQSLAPDVEPIEAECGHRAAALARIAGRQMRRFKALQQIASVRSKRGWRVLIISAPRRTYIKAIGAAAAAAAAARTAAVAAAARGFLSAVAKPGTRAFTSSPAASPPAHGTATGANAALPPRAIT